MVNTFGPIPVVQAQDFHLPVPGVMVHLSSPFNPPILKGIKVHPDNPFRFDFILDKGDGDLSGNQLKNESLKLIKYFLASLTIPEKDLWVNLSPYEKDRIIPNSFGLTEMGRDLLAEDYMLKQITASLIYPEGEIGRKFWKRIYEEAVKRYGTTNIPVNTFNKVWIVPEKAVIYENAKAGTAYVVESKLKVMLEQDYLSLAKHEGIQSEQIQAKNTNQLGSQIVREIVIPELTKEVNENKNFAQLRQVYNSLILATWYKKKIKDGILEQVYADKNKVKGVEYNASVIPAKAGIHNKINSDMDPRFRGDDTELIYQRYLQAFKKGVYNYIKEDVDPVTQETVPRKYFSGGVNFGETKFGIGALLKASNSTQAMIAVQHIGADRAMEVTVNIFDKGNYSLNLDVFDKAMNIVPTEYIDPWIQMRPGLKGVSPDYVFEGIKGLENIGTVLNRNEFDLEEIKFDNGKVFHVSKELKSDLQIFLKDYRFDRWNVSKITNIILLDTAPKPITVWGNTLGIHREIFNMIHNEPDVLKKVVLRTVLNLGLNLMFKSSEGYLGHYDYYIAIDQNDSVHAQVYPENIMRVLRAIFTGHIVSNATEEDLYWRLEDISSHMILEELNAVIRMSIIAGFSKFILLYHKGKIKIILGSNDGVKTYEQNMANGILQRIFTADTRHVDSGSWREALDFPSKEYHVHSLELLALQSGLVNQDIIDKISALDTHDRGISGKKFGIMFSVLPDTEGIFGRKLVVDIKEIWDVKNFLKGKDIFKRMISYGDLYKLLERFCGYWRSTIGWEFKDGYDGYDEWTFKKFLRETMLSGITPDQKAQVIIDKFQAVTMGVVRNSDRTGIIEVGDPFAIVDEYNKPEGKEFSLKRIIYNEITGNSNNMAMVGKKPGDRAMNISIHSKNILVSHGIEKTKTGGIDLTPANMNLQTKNNGSVIKFHVNPAMLAQLQNVPGFVPVIINIQPLKDLSVFLGLNQEATGKFKQEALVRA